MEENQIVVRGYSLTPYEIRIIERESQERALFNSSAALRQILRDYENMKAAQLAKTNGEPTAA